jgi:hypothetical protein
VCPGRGALPVAGVSVEPHVLHGRQDGGAVRRRLPGRARARSVGGRAAARRYRLGRGARGGARRRERGGARLPVLEVALVEAVHERLGLALPRGPEQRALRLHGLPVGALVEAEADAGRLGEGRELRLRRVRARLGPARIGHEPVVPRPPGVEPACRGGARRGRREVSRAWRGGRGTAMCWRAEGKGGGRILCSEGASACANGEGGRGRGRRPPLESARNEYGCRVTLIAIATSGCFSWKSSSALAMCFFPMYP